MLLLFSSFIAIFLVILSVESYSWSIHKKQWVGNTTQFDSEIGWINTPNQTVVSGKKTSSTNSLGFRSEEINPDKNYAQWFTKRFTGFVYNLTFFQSIFENSEFFYIDFFREITKKEISANELYLDRIHLSAFGNQYLSKIIINRYRSKNG